jgi:hypothetical protein
MSSGRVGELLSHARGLFSPSGFNARPIGNDGQIQSALRSLQDDLISSAEAQQLKESLTRIYADGKVTAAEINEFKGLAKAANGADDIASSAVDSSTPSGQAFGDFQRLFHEAARGSKFDHHDLARLLPKIEEHRKTLSGDDLAAFDRVVADFKKSWQETGSGKEFSDENWKNFYQAQKDVKKDSDSNASNSRYSAEEYMRWLEGLQNRVQPKT